VWNFIFTCLTLSVGAFVVATSSQPWEDKHGIFCIKCFGDIFCVIFFLYKSFVNAMGH
jgi:hypothetical protein